MNIGEDVAFNEEARCLDLLFLCEISQHCGKERDTVWGLPRIRGLLERDCDRPGSILFNGERSA